MKKSLMFIFSALLIFVSTNVYAAPTGQSGISFGECYRFADGFKTIGINEGSYYYKYCYRATCGSDSKYSLDPMTTLASYKCQNGNYEPYSQITSDGCSKYSGSCKTGSNPYCTRVEFVDCNRKKDGSYYSNGGSTTPDTPTTPDKPTIITTTRKTTKKNNNKTTRPRKSTTGFTAPTTGTTTTEAQVSSNNNIKSVTINGQDTRYREGKNEYSLKLPYDMANIDVGVELESKRATYEVIGNTNMPNEDTQMKIIVTAENGDKKEVTYNITRYSVESSDCTLANIYIEDYELEFSKNKYEYVLNLPKNVNSIDISVIPTQEQSATYEINGNEKLKNKSVIDIIVLSADGTECNYQIKIKKTSNTWKYLLLIVLLGGVLGTAIYFLYKFLKKSKGKYKYE